MLLVDDLISLDDFLQVIYIKLCVKYLAVLILNRLECILELCMRNTHYNVSEHLDETSVAVPCESLVSCLLDKCIKGIWIKTKVKDSIHHAWHGLGCTGTDRNKKRILLITKLCSHKVLKSYKVLDDFVPHSIWVGTLMLIKEITSFCCDCKSRRNRKTDTCHVCKIGTLSAKKILHVASAFGLSVAEEVNILFVCH